MRISTFLPHVGVFGGVRRFLELGNAWTRMGHPVTLYHPQGTAPSWLPYAGRVESLERASADEADLALCADPHTFDAFIGHHAAAHIYYCVLEGDPGLARALQRDDVLLAANSSLLRRAVGRRGRAVLDGIGGINTRQFRPDPSRRSDSRLRVLVNGRRSRPKKGTDLILHALGGLGRSVPAFEVLLFDHVEANNRQDPRDGVSLPPNARFVINPTQDELVSLYQSAHLFVAAERKAGWCNTALEAMACGAAVVCTPNGTADFARDGENARVVRWRHPFFLRPAIARVLRDAALRERLGRSAAASAPAWNWDALAAKLLDQLGAGSGGGRAAAPGGAREGR